MNADDKRFSVDKKFYVLHDKVFMNKYLLNTHKFMWRTELTPRPPPPLPPLQPAITRSKLTIETVEKGVRMFKINLKTPERRQ